MIDSPPRAEVLALVRSSPVYVGQHDKAGWLGIFGGHHVVEDPVGSRPVRSEDAGALARFWDTFIAPNDIEFQVAQDWVSGFDVARDVTIVSTLRPGVVVHTPAHLLYQTGYEDGTLKVRRMAAHWEPWRVYLQLMRPSPAHLAASAQQLVRMFRTLGLVPALQFLGATRHLGRRRKRRLLEVLTGEGVTRVSKLIASGRSVTATGELDGAQVAVIAWFRPRSHELREMTVYADPA